MLTYNRTMSAVAGQRRPAATAAAPRVLRPAAARARRVRVVSEYREADAATAPAAAPEAAAPVAKDLKPLAAPAKVPAAEVPKDVKARDPLADSEMATLQRLLERSKAAQEEYSHFSQEQVDKIFKAAAMAANGARIPLAKMAVEETRMGVVEDKVIKVLGGGAWLDYHSKLWQIVLRAEGAYL
ncbi:Aldehyde-alcohol dehydrogenase [Monoraphidium neglectum]|uniref:Aldehyde-alcohol dehydrogenase n=1 Tax=Monoraphidium neglectum TaxID=145388 RepID=A0A0D2MX86_9CHLO|nr:Aldehyde-alcohol dehydrogenase [Monoraphidium neglectum]KIZ05032.1 Aldehyde-alcohol dehydrogenase [Monoraphidium neglectum]|eukprot:XP_013904051.1 Aldehyde-alcohol dehydrogenase [Monoraphidium neglectum]